MRFALVPLLICLTACDVVPRDAAGAYERAINGELRVGVVADPPFTVVDDGIRGLEPDLLTGWSGRINGRIVWRSGALDELVEALHRREIDVLAAGLDARTPYKAKIAMTQPYLETLERLGQRHKHVLAVTQGESKLLFELDRYLAAQDKAALLERVTSQ
jgi:polar amino acid transport system substrate-binding protein